MADNLDLAVRVRADLQSALNGLKQMEGGVGGLDREMGKASRSASGLRSTIGQLVAGDLIARGLTAIARATSRFAAESVRAAIASESLALSMRAATGDADSAGAALAFVDAEADRLGISFSIAARSMVRLTAATRGTRLEGAATRSSSSRWPRRRGRCPWTIRRCSAPSPPSSRSSARGSSVPRSCAASSARGSPVSSISSRIA